MSCHIKYRKFKHGESVFFLGMLRHVSTKYDQSRFPFVSLTDGDGRWGYAHKDLITTQPMKPHQVWFIYHKKTQRQWQYYTPLPSGRVVTSFAEKISIDMNIKQKIAAEYITLELPQA